MRLAVTSAYLLVVTVVATCGFVGGSTGLILTAGALALPTSIAAAIGFYLAYGLLALVPGANPSNGAGDLAPWFVVATDTIGILALVAAALLNVVFLRTLFNRRRSGSSRVVRPAFVRPASVRRVVGCRGVAVKRSPAPGPGGYLIAVLVSVVATTVALAVRTGDLSVRRPDEWAPVVLVLGIYTTVAAVPVGLAGVMFVHFWCRRVEQQAVHVLAAGLAGVLPVLGVATILGGLEGAASGAPFAALLGWAAAVGRAVVIPLRPWVAQPTDRRPTRPVDNDFVPGGSAC